jgi:hypothetical protein
MTILLTLTPNPSPLMGEGCLFLILLFFFAPLSPLVGERGWGIEGECKKPTLVRGRCPLILVFPNNGYFSLKSVPFNQRLLVIGLVFQVVIEKRHRALPG